MKWIIPMLFLLVSCVAPKEEVITITGKHLIPEGIALGTDGEIYLSNLYAKNIVVAESDGTNPVEITTSYSGQFSGVGVTVKNDRIYALANNEEDGYNSVMQLIDPEKGVLLDSYELRDSLNSFLNDLAVTSDGRVFITNTYKHKIHTLMGDSLVNFIESPELEYPNGIALSPDEKRLYIASFSKGIRTYDLEKQALLNAPDTIGLTHGIDGLKFYKNSLIGIQNSSRSREDHCVVRFYLDDSGTFVTKADTLFVNHPSFNIPTTLDIKDGWVYCLANSQMENLDPATGELLRVDELTDTYILKFKLD